MATKTARRYRGEKYWEAEIPKEARVGRVLLRYFVDAQRLQVCQTFTGPDGEDQVGRVVTLDLQALAGAEEAKALLREVLADAR